ncbi:MAG: glycogen/starch synthase, partial [Candidatus Izemoplasmatales bacterium]
MINVLHVSAECSPFVKVGGLADVIGSLPNEIKRLKNSDVRVVLPFYKSIPKKYQDKAEDLFNFNIDFDEGYVGVKTLKKGNILYYFIDSQYYFGSRDNIYNYGDEGKRYTYFQLAVLGMIERLDFLVNIIHVHDWHTAMIPLIIKKKYQDMKIKSVLSLHNLQYQGIFPLQDFQLFG